MTEVIDFKEHYRAVRHRIAGTKPRPLAPPVLLPPKPVVEQARLVPDTVKVGDNIRHLARSARMRRIIEAVMEKHQIDEANFLARRCRQQKYVRARHEMFYELCKRLRYSQAHLARVMNFDHTSVRHGCIKHEARLEAGDAQRLIVLDLELRDHSRNTSTDDLHGDDLSVGVDQRGTV
jgi:hypothetical protein